MRKRKLKKPETPNPNHTMKINITNIHWADNTDGPSSYDLDLDPDYVAVLREDNPDLEEVEVIEQVIYEDLPVLIDAPHHSLISFDFAVA
jgi:hypothetical protein